LRLTLGALAFAATTGVLGHGAVQAQIDAATAAIARARSHAQLYRRRGELHRVHEDWDAALADFDRAATLAPGDDTIDFLRGRTLEQAAARHRARRARPLPRATPRPCRCAARAGRELLRALEGTRRPPAISPRPRPDQRGPTPTSSSNGARSKSPAATFGGALAGIDVRD
jgi:hypothetical protein